MFQLSISEYRQRKQRTTSTELKSQDNENDGGNESTSTFPGSRGRTNSTSSSSSLSSDNSDDTVNVIISAANKNPLLENSPSLSTLPLFLHTEGPDDKKGNYIDQIFLSGFAMNLRMSHWSFIR